MDNTNQKRDWRKPTVYSHSRAIPGQSLIPAELMKRHIAGTLPELDLSQKYEYHYDENGEQIGEPVPLEMHELYKMAVKIRKQQEEQMLKQKAAEALKFRDQIIKEYVASQPIVSTKKLEPKPAPKKTDPKKV